MEVLTKGLDGIERVVQKARESQKGRTGGPVVFRPSNLHGKGDSAVHD